MECLNSSLGRLCSHLLGEVLQAHTAFTSFCPSGRALQPNLHSIPLLPLTHLSALSMDQPLQNANTDEQTADEIRDRLVGSRQTQFVPSTEGSSDPTAAPPDYIASELGRHGAHLKLLHEVLGETYRGWKQTR